jgi:drug/metabolite transporter (DMT)-like permease
LGILSMLTAASLFSVNNILIKYLSAGFPTTEVMFFRSLFALPVGLVIIWRAGGVALIRTRDPMGHLTRALLGLAAMGFLFYAFKVLPATDTVAIFFGTPLVVTLLSIPMLGERVGWRRWLAVIVGFAGVMVIVRPGAGAVDLGAAAGLAACVFFGLVSILLRRLSRTESSATIAFYYALYCTVLVGWVQPFLWTEPDLAALWLFLLLGTTGGIAQFFLTQAYRFAPASLVAPFDYSQLLWTAGLGFLVFGETPSLSTWIGAALIVASGFYIFQREARLRADLPSAGAGAEAKRSGHAG